MTFNRYISLRMVVEIVGAVCCALLLLFQNNLVGVIATAVVAVLWIVGEVLVFLVLDRQDPRRDELSDKHQSDAMQFALTTMIAVLILLGFVYTMLALLQPGMHQIRPMTLPTLAMAALALSDARYLWLEHQGAKGDDDED
ncbi:hypothetical protein [Bifidobacterium eulemuris]|uniref:Uncharacterized protein n=1 Tax=Bifidobacterium eulemuris TaxID=1765219 RepID=A0A261GAV7_9BIFI|nr:hypothetical protein [Bifidobacterium eulemuris]OZG68571.1 hypothetical protein BEUL_0881 [Bifidobacterium eulemuris]QOL32700.1 hypothetical protein BE0216_09815 [Bifidobacterium eulemuris]